MQEHTESKLECEFFQVSSDNDISFQVSELYKSRFMSSAGHVFAIAPNDRLFILMNRRGQARQTTLLNKPMLMAGTDTGHEVAIYGRFRKKRLIRIYNHVTGADIGAIYLQNIIVHLEATMMSAITENERLTHISMVFRTHRDKEPVPNAKGAIIVYEGPFHGEIYQPTYKYDLEEGGTTCIACQMGTTYNGKKTGDSAKSYHFLFTIFQRVDGEYDLYLFMLHKATKGKLTPTKVQIDINGEFLNFLKMSDNKFCLVTKDTSGITFRNIEVKCEGESGTAQLKETRHACIELPSNDSTIAKVPEITAFQFKRYVGLILNGHDTVVQLYDFKFVEDTNRPGSKEGDSRPSKHQKIYEKVLSTDNTVKFKFACWEQAYFLGERTNTFLKLIEDDLDTVIAKLNEEGQHYEYAKAYVGGAMPPGEDREKVVASIEWAHGNHMYWFPAAGNVLQSRKDAMWYFMRTIRYYDPSEVLSLYLDPDLVETLLISLFGESKEGGVPSEQSVLAVYQSDILMRIAVHVSICIYLKLYLRGCCTPERGQMRALTQKMAEGQRLAQIATHVFEYVAKDLKFKMGGNPMLSGIVNMYLSTHELEKAKKFASERGNYTVQVSALMCKKETGKAESYVVEQLLNARHLWYWILYQERAHLPQTPEEALDMLAKYFRAPEEHNTTETKFREFVHQHFDAFIKQVSRHKRPELPQMDLHDVFLTTVDCIGKFTNVFISQGARGETQGTSLRASMQNMLILLLNLKDEYRKAIPITDAEFQTLCRVISQVSMDPNDWKGLLDIYTTVAQSIWAKSSRKLAPIRRILVEYIASQERDPERHDAIIREYCLDEKEFMSSFFVVLHTALENKNHAMVAKLFEHSGMCGELYAFLSVPPRKEDGKEEKEDDHKKRTRSLTDLSFGKKECGSRAVSDIIFRDGLVYLAHQAEKHQYIEAEFGAELSRIKGSNKQNLTSVPKVLAALIPYYIRPPENGKKVNLYEGLKYRPVQKFLEGLSDAGEIPKSESVSLQEIPRSEHRLSPTTETDAVVEFERFVHEAAESTVHLPGSGPFDLHREQVSLGMPGPLVGAIKKGFLTPSLDEAYPMGGYHLSQFGQEKLNRIKAHCEAIERAHEFEFDDLYI